ncbi:uncharacterized protein LOC111411708 [Olea europaea var. sylvestris]|uniref:uncharacterized protein LOC111411708 n=1 Tax=Olea europaea var. sylvestris TaxID=158386 RepID=UPI000C1D7493|nr:uncharacterized protein LOC111411708 [Olea europaea var. sylvestris]
MLTEISFGRWKYQNEVWKSCWRVPSSEEKPAGRYVFISLSNGAVYHAPQIVNAVGWLAMLKQHLCFLTSEEPKSGKNGGSLHISTRIYSYIFLKFVPKELSNPSIL